MSAAKRIFQYRGQGEFLGSFFTHRLRPCLRFARRPTVAFVLLLTLLPTLLSACARQDLSQGTVRIGEWQYAAVGHFQLAQDWFDDKGQPRADRSAKMARIDGSPVYSIQGLDPADWIYFDYADCNVGFYLSKNVATTLDARYYDFSDTFVVVGTEYTVEGGLREVLHATVVDGSLVSYAARIAAAEGNSDMGTTSDRIVSYALLLTPKAFPALQYVVGYYEGPNGYFLGSNANGLNTKVDDRIHEMIRKQKEAGALD